MTIHATTHSTNSRRISSGDNLIEALIFCVWSGAIFGMLAFAIGIDSLILGITVFGLLYSFFAGAIVGLFCWPIVIILIWTRELSWVKPIVFWLTTTVIFALWNLGDGISDFPKLTLLSCVAFIGSACFARLVLPRVFAEPGKCQSCGYDLRGSMEFGRCPECGKSIERDAAGLSNPGRAFKAVALPLRVVIYKPWFLILIIILGSIVPRAAGDYERERLKARIVLQVQSVQPEGHSFRASSATDFEWEILHIFTPYTPSATVDATLGFSWPEVQRTNLQSHDTCYLFVFVQDEKVVGSCELPFLLDGVDKPISLTAEEAVFEVVDREDMPSKLGLRYVGASE